MSETGRVAMAGKEGTSGNYWAKGKFQKRGISLALLLAGRYDTTVCALL